jgi:tetratricopeptide (TPR) repeat protein
MYIKPIVSVLLFCCCLLTACTPPAKKAEDQNVHYILGVSYLRENNATLALQEFQKAQAIDSRNPDVHVGLGRAYHLKKAYAEAEKHYLQALKIRPDDPLTENNLGALYLDMERLDDAARHFGKAAGNLTFPSAEVSYTGLGYAHHLKGEYLEAIDAYKKALAQNIRYAQAHQRLGETYYAMGKTDRAIGEFRQALDLNGNDVLAHFHLGLAYVKLGETAKAAASLQKVLRLAPDSELAGQAESYLEALK